MSKMEHYLKIDPDGTLSWIPICREPRHDDIYCGSEAISVQDLYPVIGCSCVEQVHSVIPFVVFLVDESGKVKTPMQPFNPVASRLYAGAPYGDFIHGSVVLFGLRRTAPYGEYDLFPLSELQLTQVSLCLGLPIPDPS